MSQAEPRVVLVDDVAANVILLQRMLATFGLHEVWSTSNPHQAVDLVLSVQPDLVLLDLHMPGMSGLDVLRALRAAWPADDYLPVLVLTADASQDAMQAAMLVGANDFVTKPFDRFEIDLRIRNLLGTRWLHLRLREHAAGLEEHLRGQQEQDRALAAQRKESVDRISAVLGGEGLAMHFQPIVCLVEGDVVGVEALARFEGGLRRTPDLWFAEAAAVGLGVELELAAVRAALSELPALPPDAYLSVNMSAETVLAAATSDLFTGPHCGRLVIELTEHAQVADYDALLTRLAALRGTGIRLAVDDTGAGFASLRHILRLRPDLIKLDLDLTRGIDQDPARRALARALLTFAAEIGAGVVAEGVETAGELLVLRDLGVEAAQGYFLGRPQRPPMNDVAAEALESLRGPPSASVRSVRGARG